MLVVANSEQLPVEQARAGEPGAWDTLFHRYQLPLYTYVFELVNDEQASLDIVQETFINAARHLMQLRDNDRFGSWLFGIAHQKCAQQWRRKPVAQVPVEACEEDLPDLQADPGDWLIRKEAEEDFMRCLNQLPIPQRTVLLLHFLEDFSLEEIAEITGAGLGTVKSRIHYAKKTLRQLLEKQR
ncbi:MAG: RNA polymerase sigma factor [Verrucomicrobiota bacterium]